MIQASRFILSMSDNMSEKRIKLKLCFNKSYYARSRISILVKLRVTFSIIGIENQIESKI